jgi:hypothetical protein
LVLFGWCNDEEKNNDGLGARAKDAAEEQAKQRVPDR